MLGAPSTHRWAGRFSLGEIEDGACSEWSGRRESNPRYQLGKQYIPVAWRATYALGISVIFAVVAETVTGGFHDTAAAVAIPAVIGVAQGVYAIIGKVIYGTTAASATAKAAEEPAKTA
ncbi:MAG: hypothetical protein ABF811_07910 [Pseudoclavibacter sp.]